MKQLSQVNLPTGEMLHDLLGLRVLLDELEHQGVSMVSLLQATSLSEDMFADPDIRISSAQKMRLLANAQSLAKLGDFALLAGARQRISDFGIFGYTMATAATFGESLKTGFRFLPLAGSLLTISRTIEGGDGVFRSVEPERLGDLLPVATEFWRASMHGLMSHMLEEPFPHTLMLLPYKPPPHWRVYEQLFRCPVHFDQDVMEWHYDASIHERKNPGANTITHRLCQRFCHSLMEERSAGTPLVREIRARCLTTPHDLPTADDMAGQLDVSLRTLHRQLKETGTSYKEITDSLRRSLAIEFLDNTSMSIEEIAARVGYSDTANFRKAFKRWTGRTPSTYRQHQL